MAIALSLWIAGSSLAENTWLQFRGPETAGVAFSDNVTFTLNTENNLVWRKETPITGWSSPLSNGREIWITSARTVEASPEQRAAKLVGAKFAKQKQVVSRVDLFATCLDAETGNVVHDIKLAALDAPNSINAMNSFASPTGCWSGDRIVFHFGRYGTFGLDAKSGNVLWQIALVIDDSMGPGSSLVEHDGVVVVPCDGMDRQFVAGLSIETGKEVWRTRRPEIDASHGEFRKSYASPLLIEVDGNQQVVVPGAQWCVAYDPQTGNEIWRFRHGTGFSIAPAPLYADGKVIFSSGYGSKELIALNPAGIGDVTDSHLIWRVRKGVPVMPSLAIVDKRIYSVTDEGILTALDIEDGSIVWRKRLGGKYSASPLVSGDRLIIGDHEGNVTVFRAGDAYDEIAQFSLGEQIMASPIPIGEDLILRTAAAVYRFSQPPTK